MFFGHFFSAGALASILLGSIVSLRQWHSSGGRGGGTSFSSLGVIAAAAVAAPPMAPNRLTPVGISELLLVNVIITVRLLRDDEP
ncbi:hypothetical protein B0T26DRAFT_518662 [Lasiosphaeria miniovina]|uniref:Uncharacterized protein n=1 Tax=Lasiosphaeria miniovina TaxID=1954250 RepID=A0AA39ZUW4_9PEZI|nr:uncharacterized protein B0T26DRAFT_518662 [Lasiosphaeria miniovina]KAK0703960.1 hypothetical protein B0T26DRAFT_518662 [Lasiosphaeria miniovina]